MRHVAAIAAAVTLLLTVFLVGVAAADTSYPNPPASVAPNTVERGSGAQVLGEQVSRSSGSLPFTGADVAELSAIGVAAIGIGLVLHRAHKAHARS